MKQYLDLCKDILNNGKVKGDRTGTGTISVFARELRFDLSKGFPLITTKRVPFKAVLGELLWFISGSTDNNVLRDKYGVTIWNEWADVETGELGRIYPAQWRDWQTADGRSIDQISELIERLKSDPDSRRHLVSAWNVGELNQMALPPCHYAFQFYVADETISCKFNMRSTDTFLGLPFNIASYALLTMMIAQQTGLKLGELIYSGGDVHLYSNHLEQVGIQLFREPRDLPQVHINPTVQSIFEYEMDDFILEGYDPHPTIKAPVAI